MKTFVSFNVNGIRAILKKNIVADFTNLNADFYIIGETKYSDDDFPHFLDGYHYFFTNSKVKKGYSGVAILAKEEPLSVHYGLKDNKYDEEGRVVTLEYDNFYLVGAYVPNAGDGLKRLPFRMEYEVDLLEYIKELDAEKPVIYTGDLNVAHNPIDLKNPKSNEGNPGYTKEEREKFTILLSNGFVDTFRQLHPTEEKYSWWSYRFFAREKGIGWRIDYYVVSERIMDKVVDSEILNEIYGSDHCPVRLKIDL